MALSDAEQYAIWQKIKAGLKIALGVGFVYEGYRLIAGKEDTPLLGGSLGRGPVRGAQQPRAGAVIQTSKMRTVANIDQRVSYIRDLVRRASTHPRVIEAKAAILARKCGNDWCVKEKDADAEIKALFDAIHDPRSPFALRYAKDHVTVDQFTHAKNLLKLHSGDCDDGCCLLGALLLCSGYPVKLRVIQAADKPTWSHIYLLVNPADGSDKWIPLDWSVKGATVGWEAPGAAECARTGKPAGMVTRVRDFNVI